MTIKQQTIHKSELSNKLKIITNDIAEILINQNTDADIVKEITEYKISEAKTILSSCSKSEVFLDLIEVKYIDIYDRFYSSFTNDKSKELDYQIKRLDKFNKSLEHIIDYISITDFQNNFEDKSPIETIIDKSDLILTKLNELFNDKTYSISTIFKLNNVNYRSGEPREIGEDLSRRGYLILEEKYRDTSDFAKISVKGASYIERKNKTKNIKKNSQEIDEKINQIIELIAKLGYGQEIIFDEINEIKDLHSKLNRKNWTELIKGKLINLGLSQIISKEVLSDIYEILVEDKLKLLK